MTRFRRGPPMVRGVVFCGMAIILSGCVVLGMAFVFDVRSEKFLVISDWKNKVLEELFLPDGSFSHVFTHSIHLTPVDERFRVEANGLSGSSLHLYELRYESSGVGMPSDAEGGYRLENGKFILSMNRTFRRIPIRVSIVEGHGIMIGAEFHPFTTWVRTEGLVEISGSVRYVLRLRR